MLGGAVFFSPSGTMYYQVQIYSLKFTDIQFDTNIHRFGALTYKCNQKFATLSIKSKNHTQPEFELPFKVSLTFSSASSTPTIFFLKSLPGAALFITCVSADSSRPQMPRVNNFPLKLTRMSHKRSSTVMRADYNTKHQNALFSGSAWRRCIKPRTQPRAQEHFPGGVDCDFVTLVSVML